MLKNISLGLFVLSMVSASASGFASGDDPYRPCNEMDQAAEAIAKINGATFAPPSYRLPELAHQTERGEEYYYQFDATFSPTGEFPGKKVGIIVIKALRKKGESICKVLELKYTDE